LYRKFNNSKEIKMIERKITNSIKDSSGNITAICNPGEWWSPKTSEEAIEEIEEMLYSYHVILNGEKVDIKVVHGETGKYLRTDPDKTTKNNLDELPECFPGNV
jgi:hypothetical protein